MMCSALGCAKQRATIALEATPLLAAEAKKNQRLGGDSSTFVKNDKPRVSQSIDARKGVAKQFDVSQGLLQRNWLVRAKALAVTGW
jgi:hypothetical protein